MDYKKRSGVVPDTIRSSQGPSDAVRSSQEQSEVIRSCSGNQKQSDICVCIYEYVCMIAYPEFVCTSIRT